MTFSFDLISAIILQKTGKTIESFYPCVLNAADLKIISEQEVPQPFYFGTVQCVDINEGSNDEGIKFLNSLSSRPISLAVNKFGSMNGYRAYDNVVFDSIEGNIESENEINFHGFQFQLVGQ